MAENNPEVEKALERKELAKRFQRLPRIFSIMPDSDMTLPTWPDIGRYDEFKMSATKPEVETTLELFPLPVLWSTFLDPDVGRCRAMKAVSYRSQARSKMKGAAAGTASAALSVQVPFSLPGYCPPF